MTIPEEEAPLDTEAVARYISENLIQTESDKWPEQWWNSGTETSATITLESLNRFIQECENFEMRPQIQEVPPHRTWFVAKSDEERVRASCEAMGLEIEIHGTPFVDPGTAIVSSINPDEPQVFNLPVRNWSAWYDEFTKKESL